MNTRALRVGIVGLGHMGRHHARTVEQADGVDLVAVADPAGDPGGALAGVPVVTDLEQLLHHRVDYVVLACPTSLHAELGVQLAAARIPTLIEKPLAGDPAAAAQLVNAYRAAGVPAAVGYIERFNPALAALRRRLEDGLLGDVFDISTRRTGVYPVRITDVGVINDLATHDIDLTAWLAGQPYTSITARTAHRSGRPYEDLLAAIAQLADGTIAQHRVNWLTPNPERHIAVTGEHGCLTADTITASLTFYGNGTTRPDRGGPVTYPGVTRGVVTHLDPPRADALLSEHQAFRDTVLGHPSPSVSLDAGLHAVLVAHAATTSARIGQTVPVTRAEAALDRPRPAAAEEGLTARSQR